ncbi:MAG: MerR family transcriptional regulator [Bacteroidia bacterium]|nr:MerR family transcriptional regulator [Bacteroidia bacterium]
MSKFSIKDIESVTGIKSHTLRVWEQRYGIIKPKRTETNIRYYDDEDLRLVLNISTLNNNGIKISGIAKMTPEQIEKAVSKVSETNKEHSHQVKLLVSSMLMLNEAGFNNILSTNILQLGLEGTMTQVIFPFMSEVGVLWQIGSIQPAHEHFITNLIKQKLYVAIDGQVLKEEPGKEKFLLFLREGEPHELGLLFANYMLRARGHQVIYLGQSLPHSELKEVFAFHSPGYVITSLTSAIHPKDLDSFVTELAFSWPEATILLFGKQIENAELKTPKNVQLMRDVSHFTSFINQLSEKR